MNTDININTILCTKITELRKSAGLTQDALAEKLELPVISGSDTHQAVQYGCISTVLEQDCTTFDEIFSQVRAGAYRIEVAQQAAFQVQTASLLKRALKEIHALGGDYVSILTAKTVV